MISSLANLWMPAASQEILNLDETKQTIIREWLEDEHVDTKFIEPEQYVNFAKEWIQNRTDVNGALKEYREYSKYDEYSQFPIFHNAVRKGLKDIVRYFVRTGFDLRFDHNRVFYSACYYNHLEILKILFEGMKNEPYEERRYPLNRCMDAFKYRDVRSTADFGFGIMTYLISSQELLLDWCPGYFKEYVKEKDLPIIKIIGEVTVT